ncbi:hypothetical protein TRVA0_044S00716 [Trichomonascus vanleenenianus]|uniref:F-box protein n=1 Tax=Trichomonascus vanleenenianus TaxID=2268995 RepID=UPI003ECB4A41
MLVTDLPAEILLLIIEHVSPSQLYDLALTCRCFKHLLYPHLWADLSIQPKSMVYLASGSRYRPVLDPNDGPPVFTFAYRRLSNPRRRLVANSFLRENKWVNHKTKRSSLRAFCKALARGDLDNIVKHVRYLFVIRPFYGPPPTVKYHYQLSDVAIDQVSDAVLERLLLENVLPSKLTNLEALEVQSSDDYLPESMTYPLINTMIQQFSNVRKTVGLDLFRPVSPKLAMRNVTALVLYISEIDNYLQLVSLFRGKCLPSGIRRFELSFHLSSYFQIEAEILAKFLSQSSSLSTLSLESTTIVNSKNVNWLPPSVTALRIDDIDSEDEQLCTFANGSSIRVLNLTTENGSMLDQSKFGSLRHVALCPLQEPSDQFIANAVALLQTNPDICLLKLADMPFKSVALILQQQLPSQVKCLYLEYYPENLARSDTDNDPNILEYLLELPSYCAGLEALFLDMACFSKKDMVTVVWRFLGACPKLQRLCLTSGSIQCHGWSISDYLATEFDDQSSIVFEHTWDLIDIPKFKSTFPAP